MESLHFFSLLWSIHPVSLGLRQIFTSRLSRSRKSREKSSSCEYQFIPVITENNDPLSFQAIQQAGGPRYSLGSSGRLLYPASGGSDDWAKGKMGIKYSYTLELRDSGRYGFVLPASFIQPTAKEAYAAVRAIVSEA